MALSRRVRKRLSILLLVVWMPLYVVVAARAMTLFERPPIWIEVPIYVALGVAWALPFRWVFLGVDRPEPDEGDGRGGRR